MNRQSNFELLRIVAMVMVVITHMNFSSLGFPSYTTVEDCPSSSFIRILVECLSIVCVNVFVMISGWFGIKPKVQKFCSFIYQCLFFSVGLYLVSLFIPGSASFSTKALVFKIFLTDYWFIPCYIGLYLLSPILNSFIENTEQKKVLCSIVAFFIFEFLFGFLFNNVGFVSGYSVLSFVGLYLLGRYVNKYPSIINHFSFLSNIGIYFILCLTSSILAFLILKFQLSKGDFMFRYSSPLMIGASLFFLLAFSKLRFSSKIINVVAGSAFSIYLFHHNPLIMPKFIAISKGLYLDNALAPYLLKATALILVIMAISFVLDQIRIYSWKLISAVISKLFIPQNNNEEHGA